MPKAGALRRARADRRAGKSASTQAGEFVRAEIEQIRKGKHGARSAKQAIAIGLSEARRAGVKVKPSRNASPETKRRAEREIASARPGKRVSAKRSTAATKALKKEPRAAASTTALSRHAKSVARSRTKAERSASAKKAARTRAARGK